MDLVIFPRVSEISLIIAFIAKSSCRTSTKLIFTLMYSWRPVQKGNYHNCRTILKISHFLDVILPRVSERSLIIACISKSICCRSRKLIVILVYSLRPIQKANHHSCRTIFKISHFKMEILWPSIINEPHTCQTFWKIEKWARLDCQHT